MQTTFKEWYLKYIGGDTTLTCSPCERYIDDLASVLDGISTEDVISAGGDSIKTVFCSFAGISKDVHCTLGVEAMVEALRELVSITKVPAMSNYIVRYTDTNGASVIRSISAISPEAAVQFLVSQGYKVQSIFEDK